MATIYTYNLKWYLVGKRIVRPQLYVAIHAAVILNILMVKFLWIHRFELLCMLKISWIS